eukprot:7008846-Lingulodinium_polyedra.AAC.1
MNIVEVKAHDHEPLGPQTGLLGTDLREMPKRSRWAPTRGQWCLPQWACGHHNVACANGCEADPEVLRALEVIGTHVATQ